jgi:hypothetical protein
MRTLVLMGLALLPTACSSGGSTKTTPRPSDSSDSGVGDVECPELYAGTDALVVAPDRVFEACAEPTGRTYVDASADWGFDDPARGAGDHNKGGVAAVADFDGNGFLDIVFGYSGADLRLYSNTGSGFERTTLTDAHGEGPLAVADIDGDGLPDLISLGPPESVWLNTGTALEKQRSSFGLGAPLVDLSPADFDGDGHLDLYGAAAGPHSDNPADRADRMLRGDGTGQFESADLAVPAAGGLGFDSIAADLDADGDIDVYTVNDFGASLGGNVLWENDGGQLVSRQDDCACDLAISGMGIDVADLDGDAVPELLIASTGTNHLLKRDASGAYYDIAETTGADPLSGLPSMAWGQVFFDYNDDGLLDLVVAEGDLWLESTDPDLRTTYDGPIHVMVNEGSRSAPLFVDRAADLGLSDLGSWRAIVPADFNNDGEVDLLLTDVEAPPRLMLAQGCTGNGAIEVDAPFQARVEACIGGERHVAWARTESGWGASRPAVVRFGTGTHPAPDTVVVVPAR